MTKPGDQFVIRKLVYAGIRELFETHGIEFAHRQVTFHIADEDEDESDEAKRKAALGAAQSILDEPQQRPPSALDS